MSFLIYTMTLVSTPGPLKTLMMSFVNLDEAFDFSCASSVCEPTTWQRKTLISSSTIFTSMAFVARCRGGAKCSGPCRIATERVNDMLAGGVLDNWRLYRQTSEWTFEKWAYECRCFNIPFRPLMAPLYYHKRLDDIWEKQMSRPLRYAVCSHGRCGSKPNVMDAKLGYLCINHTIYYYKKGRCDARIQTVLAGVPSWHRRRTLFRYSKAELVPGTEGWAANWDAEI